MPLRPSALAVAAVFLLRAAPAAAQQPAALPATPDSSLGSSFIISSSWSRNDTPTVAQVGYLVASEHVGWMVLAPRNRNGSQGAWSAYVATRAGSAPGDSLILSAGGGTFGGHYTAGGGFVASGRLDSDSSMTASVHGSPLAFPPTSAEGLYSASVQTLFDDRGRVGDPTAWTGELAVVVLDSTVYMDLYLVNPVGGVAGITGHSTLAADGGFEIVYPPTGSRLSGKLHDGVIEAHWVDIREHGNFSGDLRASRR